MANLGFVGLGVMGSRMVKRLLDAGHSVTGYNRTKSKAQWLLDAGMKWADTPRAVAEASDIIFSMVTNTEALRAITEGADGIFAGLSAGKIYIDMSTVSPAASRETAEQVETKGAADARRAGIRQRRSPSKKASSHSWSAASGSL